MTLTINGRLGLELVDERRVDRLIPDLMMPVMDSAELAAAFARPRYRAIPSIIMTSLPTSFPKNNGLYDAVLRKPFTPEALLGAIEAGFERW